MNLNSVQDHIQGKESEYSLLLGDTDRIHAYVFETSRLPEIRGASQLLRTLITKEFDCIFKRSFTDVSSLDKIEDDTNLGYKIYNEAGSCMAIVPTNRTEEFVNAVTEKFCRETGAATITFVHAPLSTLPDGKSPLPKGEISKWILESNQDALEDYMKLLQFLQHKLRMEKKKKSYLPFIESNSIVRRCDHCGKRPAVYKWEYQNETEHICSICLKKRCKGEKSDILTKLAEKDEFYTSYIEKSPRDLDNLVGNSGYIGILYADGNEMGKKLFGAKTLEEFQDISKKIEGSILTSMDPLLKGFENHSEKYLPFEILNKAGDDILMILQSEYVLEFSLNLLRNFETICSKELHDDITMSLGATIFKVRYPVQYAFEIAKSLLKDAKRFSKQDTNKPQSAISYLYMKTPVAATSSKEVQDSYYKGLNNVYLTMRPYTLDEFKLLLDAANKIKKDNILTNSQIGAISRSFEEKSLYSTMNFIKYQIARISIREKRKSLIDVITKLKEKFKLKDLDGTDELPLWGDRLIGGEEKKATPFLDIFEILEISGGGFLE